MTGDELQDLTQHLVDAHHTITEHLRWRPRRAAKDLCKEFRVLLERGDFWNQFEKTGQELERFRDAADEMLGNIRKLVTDEAEVLARLGIDQAQIGNIVSSVYDAVDLANARTADTTPPGIRNLRDRLGKATDLICQTSRGPLLRTMDFVVSKKGALTLAARAWRSQHLVCGGGRWRRAVARVNEDCGCRSKWPPGRNYPVAGLSLHTGTFFSARRVGICPVEPRLSAFLLCLFIAANRHAVTGSLGHTSTS